MRTNKNVIFVSIYYLYYLYYCYILLRNPIEIAMEEQTIPIIVSIQSKHYLV